MISRLLITLLLICTQAALAQEINLRLERSVEADLYFPTDICGNDRGDVFVLDGMNDRVIEINARGQVRSITPDRGTIYKAVGLTCIDNNIWIADTPRARIIELSRNGRINRIIPLGEGTEPVDVVKINGQILVSDRANHRILVLDLDGNIKSTWGNRGNDIGEFINPSFLTAAAGNRLLISDILNRRVLSFSPSGRFPQMVVKPGVSPGQIVRPKGIAGNSQDEIWVADGYTGTLQLFSLSGKHLGLATASGQPLNLQAPMGIWIDGDGNIWVVESTGNKVSKFRVEDE